MAIIPQPNLFSWKQIDAASDLDRLKLVLSVLPDERLVSLLEKRRDNGRDDYPIRPCWNMTIAGIVFQHPSAESVLRELRRNGELRQLCGFDPFAGEVAVPSSDAFGRFLQLIVECQDELLRMFDLLVDELKKELPDLGAKLATDSKAIKSAGKPVRDEDKANDSDGRRDTDADWGKKVYKGKRQDGTVWEKVVSWFGYKLHLLVDTTYEMPLVFKLTKASAADAPELLPLVDTLEEKHPEVAASSNELAADKAYDSEDNNSQLYDEYGIKPVIDIRSLWKDEKSRPLFPDRCDSFIYEETGRVMCICPLTGERRDLFFCGFEEARGTLKYRCPAAAFDFECKGRAQCEQEHKVGQFGRVVRIPLEKDRRIFTPIARCTEKWEKAYDRRTAVERVNSRIDRVFGFEEHFIRGQKKMETRVTLALIVLLAMALGRIRADQKDLMRSLIAPVRRAA